MTSEIIIGAPVLLKTINAQIKEAGGTGFKSEVKQNRLQGSFAVQYHFETIEGRKTLQLPNELRLARINTPDKLYYVVYNGDTGEFALTHIFYRKTDEKNILFITPLGNSHEEAGVNLQKHFPDVENFTIENPKDLMNRGLNKS
jgi:hypothetical protein